MIDRRFYLTFFLAMAMLVLASPAVAADSDRVPRVDAVAVYNRGAAVIQTTRTVDLDEGEQPIGWPIGRRLRPGTLWLEGDGVQLSGLTIPARDNGGGLLAARIGQPVTLLRDDVDSDTRARQATLVGVDRDSVFVRVEGRIERLTGDSPWRVSWPAGDDNPDGLRLDVVAEQAGARPLTATYQIDGPSWQASYTGRFDAEAGRLSLQSTAVIDNSGGTALAADQAWLVAGYVARATGGPQPVMMARSEAQTGGSGPPEATGDAYRYALDGGIDVAAGATRAVSLMAPVSFDAERRYRFENRSYAASRDGQRSHAEVRLAFDNTADVPLPAGLVRVYDSEHKALLMGADRIADTPQGAPITLSLGHSFDLTGERRLVEKSRTENGQRQRSVEIILHNAGKQKAAVEVVEHLPDGATITSASIEPAADSAANTGVWQISVPAGGKTTLRYSATWPGSN